MSSPPARSGARWRTPSPTASARSCTAPRVSLPRRSGIALDSRRTDPRRVPRSPRRLVAAPSRGSAVLALRLTFIGFKDRSAIGRRLRSTEIAMGRTAPTPHVIVVDGQLVGGWKRALTNPAVIVELSLLAGLSESEEKA